MPRYKVQCAWKDCESVWWVVRPKMGVSERMSLSRSICQKCADRYRAALRDLRDGTLNFASDKERKQWADVVDRLRRDDRGWVNQGPGKWPREGKYREAVQVDLAEMRAELAEVEAKLPNGFREEKRWFRQCYARERLILRWRIMAWEKAYAEGTAEAICA